MSIENNLASIAASLATIAEVLKRDRTTDTPAAPVAVPAPVAAAPVVAAPTPVPAPVVAARRRRAGSGCTCLPDHRPASLVAYVMASYKEMGPVKGNQIQGVLAALGITNINEATAAHYPAIYSGVEALKAQ